VTDLAGETQRLHEAGTTEEFVDAVWDLRDSAYDHPEAWTGLTAETLFQALGETLEGELTRGADDESANRLLAKALRNALGLPN
jgi:hypothetical protein